MTRLLAVLPDVSDVLMTFMILLDFCMEPTRVGFQHAFRVKGNCILKLLTLIAISVHLDIAFFFVFNCLTEIDPYFIVY